MTSVRIENESKYDIILVAYVMLNQYNINVRCFSDMYKPYKTTTPLSSKKN